MYFHDIISGGMRENRENGEEEEREGERKRQRQRETSQEIQRRYPVKEKCEKNVRRNSKM